MDLDWSEQSPHIRTLFRPWQPGDGYDEATLLAAEARLGVRLPATLWAFYRAWGRRRDLTRMQDTLLAPDQLMVRADALIFSEENQGSWYWAVPRKALEEANPPIVIALAGELREVQSTLPWRPSHPRLSNFLDDFTYWHAIFRGAVHGGSTDVFPSPPRRSRSSGWSNTGAKCLSPSQDLE